MSYNLRNRSFLKEIDFSPGEFRFLLRLSEALKIGEVRRHRDASGSTARRSLSSSRRPRRGRARPSRSPPSTRAPTSPTSTRRARRWATRSRSPTRPSVLGRMYDAIEYRGNEQDDVEELARHAGVPVYNGLTDEWHPTQMLADFLTMDEHRAASRTTRSRTASWATAASTWAARSSSPARSWAATSASCGPQRALAAGRRRRRSPTSSPRAAAPRSRSPTTSSRSARGRRLRPHRRLGVDGRVQGRLGPSASTCCAPTRSTPRPSSSTGNRKAKFMHCLPAFHDTQHRRRQGDHGAHRHARRPRSHRRGVRVAGQHRLRPGREPPAHDQGRPRRHPRRLTRTSPPRAARSDVASSRGRHDVRSVARSG